MRALLLTLLLVFNYTVSSSQVCTTLVVYDNIEAYTWTGIWWTGTTSGYYTNASVSPSTSAALYGLGGGTSAIESDWYVLPNVTGLNPTYTYIFQFRLGSYRFSNSTAATAGTDNADYVEVQLSTDGEITYNSEMRIRGNANSYWDYNTNATATKTANGVVTVYTPAAGGNRTATGDGYSVIRLQLPAGTTQCAVDLFCRTNSAGEEWWIDNVELLQIAPCTPLPIELVSFEGTNYTTYNQLIWVTATELNNSHFFVERSLNGMQWLNIAKINGAGTVSTPSYYNYNDFSFEKSIINYYRLNQIDYDGTNTYSPIIAIESSFSDRKCLDEYFNLDGKQINLKEAAPGLYIHKCGEFVEKIIKLN